MSISLQYAITGGKELEAALREMGEAAGQKGGPVKLALKDAATPLLDEMQMRVAKHTDTGTLLESIEMKRHPNPIHLNEIYGVGVHRPGKRDGGGAWYAWVVEYGGWYKAGPLKGFARGTLEDNRRQTTNLYTKRLAARMIPLAKKIGHKNAQVVAAKVQALHNKPNWTSRLSDGPVEAPFKFVGSI